MTCESEEVPRFRQKSHSTNVSQNEIKNEMTSTALLIERSDHKKRDSSADRMHSRDWRKALRTPHIYRVGNSTLRLQNHFLILIVIFTIFIIFYYGYPALNNRISSKPTQNTLFSCASYSYNKTYPLTNPDKTYTGITYTIAIVSDLDQNSKNNDKKNTWESYFKKGYLTYMASKNLITVKWDSTTTLTSTLSMKGRGMELSELTVFDGRLLTFDDRTGAVFVIENEKIYPWLILMDGDGKDSKGFKTEWTAIKDEHLYIGSMGKEWTTATGEFEHNNPQWVKVVSPRGEVQSLNWITNYKNLRKAIDIEYPGYMIHESGAWSDIHKKWFFLPRRCSKNKYNEVQDELNSCNVLLTADENFSNIQVTNIGKVIPVRGFSSFKFLPDSEDSIIIALKSEEFQGKTSTYITAFKTNGEIIMPDQKVADLKFEGLEFV